MVRKCVYMLVFLLSGCNWDYVDHPPGEESKPTMIIGEHKFGESVLGP